VVYDLPETFSGLPENVAKAEKPKELGSGAQGNSSFKRIGYGGPCPPPGHTHRYFFRLYALSARLGLSPGATKRDVEREMSGRVLATAQVMGTYSR
jgi:Raf kinase inhibitor-like YbhB/YbcL family protein